jgi:hypothetical protein
VQTKWVIVLPEEQPKAQKSKKADFYKSDTASIEMLQGGVADEKASGQRDSYKSDKASVGKLQESVHNKGETKNERAGEES